MDRLEQVVVSPVVESKPRFTPRRIAAGLTIAVTMLAGLGFLKQSQESGDITKLGPEIKTQQVIDNTLNIASWNMQGKASTRYKQIGKLAAKYDLDAIALQEVTKDDFYLLHNKFKTWTEVFVMGDKKQHILEGGYGNILLTRQDTKDVRSRSIPGTALMATATGLVTGFARDIATANEKLKHTKDGLQESRASIAGTIQANVGGKIKDVRLVTGHIAGITNGDRKLHDEQFKDFFSFIGSNIKKDQITVVCADFNSGPDYFEPAISHLKMRPMENKKPTSFGSTPKIIDGCGYYENEGDGLGNLQVLDKPMTDHKPLIASWTFNQ